MAATEFVRLRSDPEMEGGRAPRVSHEVEELQDGILTSSLTSVGSRSSSRWSESDPMRPSLEGMDAAELQEYCQQVFHLCDPEGKGYITRQEIARFCDRRNSALDLVMTSLDADHDGQISFEEFQSGFQAFSENLLNSATSPGPTSCSTPHSPPPPPPPAVKLEPPPSPPHIFPSLAKRKAFFSNEEIYESNPSLAEDGGQWYEVAERIDPDGLLNGTDAQRVWMHLSSQDSVLLGQFESFLSEMVEELKQSQEDRENMKKHVKKVMDQHSREVSEMEEILEQQLCEVKEDHRQKNATKTKRLSTHFESLLADREALIDRLASQESSLKHALEDKARAERELKEEKERLLSANQVLAQQLDTSSQQLAVTREAISRLAAKEDSPTSPEYDSLGRPLDILRELEGEEGVLGTSPVIYYPPKKSPVHRAVVSPEVIGELPQFENIEKLEQQPPVARRLFPTEESGNGQVESRGSQHGEGTVAQEEGSTASTHTSSEPMAMSHDSHMTTSTTPTQQQIHAHGDGSHDNRITSPDNHMSTHSNHVDSTLSHLTNHVLSCSSQMAVTNPNNRSPSGSKNTSLVVSSWFPQREDLPRPTSPTAINRVFKVVFLGNSGVGKTSLILQLSEGHFVSSCGNTLGLDFTTKTLNIGDERIVFQLWDTAGQERFHNALTTVYFRRADAFVIVYDVTDRKTFQNTKAWLAIIQAALRERPPVLMVVGNKSDKAKERVVSIEEGRRLALELHAMFSEMSALSGDNVEQAHTTLAQLLLARENEEIERAKRAAIELNSRGSARPKRCAC